MSIKHIPGFIRFLLGYASMLMPDGMRGKKRLGSLREDLATRCVHAGAMLPPGSRSLIYSPEYIDRVRDYDPYQQRIEEFRAVSDLDITAQQQYSDVRMYLADDILVKVDKASMFNSLETRTPLLDQHLAEYIASLPSSIRTRNDTLKYLLKKSAADMLPPEILTRRKQGFGVPIKHWFRRDLIDYAHELLDSPRARQRGILNPAYVRNLLNAHHSTRLVNFSDAIWALLCLELWFQIYMDEPPMHVEQHAQTYITTGR
jgi:asparagine synthase (glutamine-hydrolysing)